MANKKVSQLVSKPSVLVTDLFPIADPTTGQLFKTTISDLGTAIGSGVSSVNTLVGAVVLDTDDIQELASPTNRWFTDTRARAALSASSPLAYNSGTGVFSIPAATSSQDGYLTSADWTTFNAKQAALSGTGFVKISGTTISYDNSTYLTTSAAASTYLALSGGTLTGALNGTSATFSGDVTLSATNPRLYFTDTDNNPDYFISNTDGTFTVYDVTNSTSRFTIGTTGNGTFGGNLTVGQIIRSGGTSAEFLKADGSVDSSTYLTTGTAASTYLPLSGGTLTGALTGTSVTLSNSLNFTSIYGGNINGYDGTSLVSMNYSASQHQYYADGTLKMMLLGNGNLLLGTTTDNGSKLQISGTATFSSSVTATSFVKSGGTSSQFLKADGSVDSTAYLPLTGGTLTGNLNGTNITISNSLIAKGGTFNGGALSSGIVTIDGLGSNVLMNRTDTNNGTLISFLTDAVEMWHIGMRSGGTDNFVIYNSNLLANAVSVNISNSAVTLAGALSGTSATFSGDLAVNSPIISINTASSNGARMKFISTSTNGREYQIGSNFALGTGEFAIYDATAASVRFSIASNGAATFSSSLTATDVEATNQFITSGGNLRIVNSGGQVGMNWTSASGGDLYFRTASTERLRITSGGNVGIGTTSPNDYGAGYKMLAINGSTAGILQLRSNDSGIINIVGTSASADFEAFASKDITFKTGVSTVSERMRITSSGNVGIGTASPETYGANLAVQGSGNGIISVGQGTSYTTFQSNGQDFYLNMKGTGNTIFRNGSGDTERMRITSGGDVAIGDTSAFGYKFRIKNSAAVPYGISMVYTASPNVTGDNQFIICADGTNDKFVVWSSGTVQNRTGVYGTISDVSLKQNIINATPKLEDLSKLKVRNFNFIGEDLKQIGFVAQEIEEIFPNLVDTDKHGTKSVKTTVLIPILVKAVQELKAELDTLKNK